MAEAARGLVHALRTTAGRAGLLHAGLSLLVALAILATVYLVTAVYERRATEEAIAIEAQQLSSAHGQGGLEEVTRRLAARLANDATGRVVYALLDGSGRSVAGNLPQARPVEGWQWLGDLGGGHEDDSALGLGMRLPRGSLLFIGRRRGQLEELEEAMIRAVLAAGAVAVVLSLVGGLLVGRAVQRRAHAMNVALTAVAEGDLTQRLPARPGGDEFDALARSMNATLARLQHAVSRLSQVTGDIAHDLRTPLSRMRQRLERALRLAAEGPVPREAVDRAIADADEVLGIFAALLRIAQVEAGERRANFHQLDLSASLRDAVEALGPAAEDAGHPIELVIEPGVRLRGDRELLQQATINLVENVLRHTPPGTPLRFELRREPGYVLVQVTDRGPGIAALDRERVLQPFVRLDESRSTPGTGLGLALVSAVASLHGASLHLSDAAPGLVVTLRFPSGAEA